YHNRTRLPQPLEQQLDVRYVDKDELVATSAFVVVTSTIQPGAPPVLGAADVARLQPDAIVVNVGRGAAVDEDALAARMRTSSRGGVGLDVFAVEPVDPLDFTG